MQAPAVNLWMKSSEHSGMEVCVCQEKGEPLLESEDFDLKRKQTDFAHVKWETAGLGKSLYGLCLKLILCHFLPLDLSLVRFITTELTRGYFLEHNEAKYTERRERVYTCLRIPKELEKVNVHTNTARNDSEITEDWINVVSLCVFLSRSRSLVDDIRLLPLSGCLSVCVHPAAPQGDSGPFTPPHVALLWPQVMYVLRKQPPPVSRAQRDFFKLLVLSEHWYENT